ncbi:MAG TPA: ThiF family adenylyltransferase [Candidatus Limnocylindrales bacterium]|nr:ThiF family adenylyltransferase [Candidatus Limnocylindrales bacterium]
MQTLRRAVQDAAATGTNSVGESYRYISLLETIKLTEDLQLARRAIEIAALEADIIPERYQRNLGTIGTAGQIRLLHACVGVLGAGGLGGLVLELLARMGVGRLVVVDGDFFSDSNLNRQLLATERTVQESKTETALRRINEINGSVEVKAFSCRGELSNLAKMFSGCDLVIDCLDNLSSRFDLEETCRQLGIIMVHGAIAGMLGQLAVIRPDRPLLSFIYGPLTENGAQRGVEILLGNPASTPAMLASWQVNEAVKILAGLEGVLPPDRLLIIDMQSGESYSVQLA